MHNQELEGNWAYLATSQTKSEHPSTEVATVARMPREEKLLTHQTHFMYFPPSSIIA